MIGDLTHESAGYVASYCTKKLRGQLAQTTYRRVDLVTGEVYPLPPIFASQSKRPMIGETWFEKYGHEVYRGDSSEVIDQGKRAKPPRAYDRLLARRDPDQHAAVKARRVAEAHVLAPDSTPKRLRTRKSVVLRRTRAGVRALPEVQP